MASLFRIVPLAVPSARLNIYKPHATNIEAKHLLTIMSDSQSSSAQWVERALVELLSAPHISIPPLRGPGGIIGGPGPIDLFSTKFNNTFTADATGVVDGDQVDREGLKQKLLALQTHFNPKTVTSQEASIDNSGEVCVSLKWTSSDSGEHKINTVANVVKQSGADKISLLVLHGAHNLFVKSGSS